MRRADRLFEIVLLLGKGRAMTAHTLSEKLEVSERTIYRDMADLMASGLQVDGEAGVGYLLRPGARLPPLMFDSDELAALALGSRMVHGWTDRDLGRAAERALLKIESVLPEHHKRKLERQALLVPEFHIAPEQLTSLGIIRRAIEQNRKLRFGYTRADGATSKRSVCPVGLFFWGGGWSLGAWCELRQDFRNFRLDRLDTLELLEENCAVVAGRTLADFLRSVNTPR